MRHVLVISQVAVAYFLLFSAIDSSAFINVTVLRQIAADNPDRGIDPNSGYYCFVLKYLALTVSNFFTPSIVAAIGAKWGQIIGAICYTLFLASFLFLRGWMIYVTSALMGLGSALMWTANGSYFVAFSTKAELARNSRILWIAMESAIISGGIFLFFTLADGKITTNYNTIYLSLTIIAVVSIAILTLLPSGPESKTEKLIEENVVDKQVEKVEKNYMTEMKETFRLLGTFQMFLLSIVFMFIGMSFAFTSGIFSSCLLSFTALQNKHSRAVPWAGVFIGVGGFTSLLFVELTKKLPFRNFVVITATISCVGSHLLSFLVLPKQTTQSATLDVAFVEPRLEMVVFAAFLMGTSDALWSSQIYILLGRLYKKNASSAFALFKLFKSLAQCLTYLLSSRLDLHLILFILSTGALSSAVLFIYIERKSGNQEMENEKIEMEESTQS